MDVTESRNPFQVITVQFRQAPMSQITCLLSFQGLSEEPSLGKRKILPDDHSNNDSAYGSPAPEEG